jgi:serine phosphatase RsbU (regulator of sigma subunit)
LRREGGILGQTAIPSLNHSARGGELGEKTTSPFTEELVELLPGDLIIGYTDGATETLSRLQLSALCEEALDAGQTPKAIADAIIDKVIKNRGPDDQADDTTVFVVKVK